MTKAIAAAFKVAVMLSVLTAAAVYAFNSLGNPFTQTIDRSGATMVERIRTLEEFTAAEGQFSQVVDLESDTKFVPAFLSGERVTAIVAGTVRATVDFSDLDAQAIDVDEESGTIRITLPSPVLTDADIDEKSVRIFRDRGLTDRVEDFFASNPTDDSPVYQAAEARINGAADQSNLPDLARVNTEQMFRAFLVAAGFQNVSINWQQPFPAVQGSGS